MKHFIQAVSGILIPLIALATGCTGCTGSNVADSIPAEEKLVKVKGPGFSQDSAFNLIQKQLSFGFRVPGTKEHKNCADWLYAELKKYCDTVYYQKGNATTYDKKTIPVYNLIGSFRPGHAQRAMLASHWDSRPWGDADTKDTDKPIPAANDGASGVAVLLELARNLKGNKPPIGVDIVFFDAEDYGKSEVENSFCLGSQYWAKHLHKPGYRAQFGVLLDMVGGNNAKFMWEGHSDRTANWVLVHTWGIAQELGFGNYFVSQRTGEIIDDHRYVNEATGIPMIDIIQHDPSGRFAPYWHTHADNMDAVDKNTLYAVGHTITALVFNPPLNLIQ